MSKIIYLVKYSTGTYEEYQQHILFATEDKDFAKKYVERLDEFSRFVTNYYNEMEDRRPLFSDDWYNFICEDREQLIQQFSTMGIGDYNCAFYEEVEIRNPKK